MKAFNNLLKTISAASLLILLHNVLFAQQIQYTMPVEWAEHEGTWLVWPHDSTYGPGTRDKFEPAWIEMTKHLVGGENVHIVAYNQAEQDHIVQLLSNAAVSLEHVNFYIHPNDDYWIRDNGPIFVQDENGEQFLTDWGFNGWGNDAPFLLDDQIPALIGSDIEKPVVDLSAMILEGGAIDIDGNGTLMATKSSITGDGRNPGLTDEEIENYLTTYLGVTNFIWLNGKYGGNFDITDTHIDGFAKFHDSSTIVTMNAGSLTYWFISAADQATLYNATNVNGNPYNYVFLPLTKNIVKTTWGASTGSKASYVNYYVANDKVLVPTYADPNDAVALAIIQELFDDKEVVGIDCRNMFSWGGMVHCVVQQQPLVQACSLMASVNPTGIIQACKGTDVTLTCNNTGEGITYQWRKDGVAISGATAATYTNSNDEAGFDVVVSLGNCSNTSPVVTIDRLSKPASTIVPQGNLDICATGSVGLLANAGNNFLYQWKKNNVTLAGASNQLYTATGEGNYKVVVTNKKGCSKTSKVTAVTSSCRKSTTAELSEFLLYPNPASDFIVITIPFETAELSIFNSLGEIVIDQKIGEQQEQVDVSTLVPGLYVIRIISGNVVQTKKLVKE